MLAHNLYLYYYICFPQRQSSVKDVWICICILVEEMCFYLFVYLNSKLLSRLLPAFPNIAKCHVQIQYRLKCSKHSIDFSSKDKIKKK